MSRRRSVGLLLAALGVGALASVDGCGRVPPTTPGDPILDAIRAEEREGGQLNYSESQGKHLFALYCATCHGDEGKGDGQNASNLTPAPPDLTAPSARLDAALIRRVITEGSASVGRSPLSPPLGRNLSRQEIEYLVAYCLRLPGKKR